MSGTKFIVETYNGHAWVTHTRSDDLDAAGHAARALLAEDAKQAIRLTKSTFNPKTYDFENSILFSHGRIRAQWLPKVKTFVAAASFAGAGVFGMAAVADSAWLSDMFDAPTQAVAQFFNPSYDDPLPAASARPMASDIDLAALAPAAGSHGDVPADIEPIAEQFDCDAFMSGHNTDVPAETAADTIALCRSATDGNAPAQRDLGLLYRDGNGGVVRDDAMAVGWLQRAARSGEVAAYAPLAALLLADEENTESVERAIGWLHAAAVAGDSDSAVQLAAIYRADELVAPDPRMALAYDMMAAELGETDAMRRVADAFAQGIGTVQDERAAARWQARADAAETPVEAVTVNGASSEAAAPQPAIVTLQWESPIAEAQAPGGALAMPPAFSAIGATLDSGVDMDSDFTAPAGALGATLADAHTPAAPATPDVQWAAPTLGPALS